MISRDRDVTVDPCCDNVVGLMRNWANTHGKCVRQRAVRQEASKYKAGTLPLPQTAVHRGERLEFAPIGKSRTT